MAPARAHKARSEQITPPIDDPFVVHREFRRHRRKRLARIEQRLEVKRAQAPFLAPGRGALHAGAVPGCHDLGAGPVRVRDLAGARLAQPSRRPSVPSVREACSGPGEALRGSRASLLAVSAFTGWYASEGETATVAVIGWHTERSASSCSSRAWRCSCSSAARHGVDLPPVFPVGAAVASLGALGTILGRAADRHPGPVSRRRSRHRHLDQPSALAVVGSRSARGLGRGRSLDLSRRGTGRIGRLNRRSR